MTYIFLRKILTKNLLLNSCLEDFIAVPNDEDVPVSAENKEAQTSSEGDDVPDDARAMAEAESQVQEVMEENNEASSSENSKDVEDNLNESNGRKDNEEDSKVTTTMEREEKDKVAEERTSESGQEENVEEDDFQDEEADKVGELFILYSLNSFVYPVQYPHGCNGPSFLHRCRTVLKVISKCL